MVTGQWRRGAGCSESPWWAWRKTPQGRSFQRMYEFPSAAVTNYPKLSGLFSYSSGAQKSKNGSHWAKIEVSAGLCSFLGAPGEKLSHCLFLLPEAARIPWLMATPPPNPRLQRCQHQAEHFSLGHLSGRHSSASLFPI